MNDRQVLFYLQEFDGLFAHQLLFLVPLHGAHHAGPDDADHGLLREVGLLHLLFGEGDDLHRVQVCESHQTSQSKGRMETDLKPQRVAVQNEAVMTPLN